MNIISLRLADGKIVGRIENGTARIPVRAKNYLAMGRGYSVDGHALEQIVSHGCGAIIFNHEKTGASWRITLDHFHCIAKGFDFGYGMKWVAPLSACERLSDGDTVQ